LNFIDLLVCKERNWRLKSRDFWKVRRIRGRKNKSRLQNSVGRMLGEWRHGGREQALGVKVQKAFIREIEIEGKTTRVHENGLKPMALPFIIHFYAIRPTPANATPNHASS